MSSHVDVVVVGGGLIGLATAWQLVHMYPTTRVCVVEAETNLGAHQSSHNSGVVHAGIYYRPGSMKARMCMRGKRLLEQFCAERGVPINHNGKLVIATRENELDRLANLFDRAHANGVPGLRRLDARGLKAVEPAAAGIAAIHSPFTGVVDFEQVATVLADELRNAGVKVRTSWPVQAIVNGTQAADVVGQDDSVISARAVVTCAGLQADRLAGKVADDVRIVPFRGGWFTLGDRVQTWVRGSIYPVPDPALPFLGVHVTRRIDGQVWAGPNAFLALSRRDYRRWAVRPRDAASALGFAGLWRFGAHNLGAARMELSHDVSVHAYARALRRYLPGICGQDLQRGPIGIRAQAMNRRGVLLEDFHLRHDGRVLHVLNAPSPAATSSLAIGEYLAQSVMESH